MLKANKTPGQDLQVEFFKYYPSSFITHQQMVRKKEIITDD